ncbi:hypothetical protein BX661DRAFT_172565 [Kickxella alabastrina]|uniref:uncharacterized protein n=1 Tax=Kickxella alabastrina TaxID=61397 RepID=UPI002220F099|nr:uncharacterized protein BX661DRAFT_172565 [Kickxella alabastrina]KAI7823941.1 hypothetical protein BX661DRAFT_172565 [Kickxella alabastrina]
MSADFDQNAAMLDLDSIREFQKEAIWRQMQEYKRDATRAQRRTVDLERRQRHWVEHIGSVCEIWDKAVHELDVIVNGSDLAASASQTPSAASQQESWLNILLPTRLPSDYKQSTDGTSNDNANTSDAIQETTSAVSSLGRFNASVANVLKQLQNKGNDSSSIDWTSAVDRLARMRASQSEVDDLKSQVALMSRQLSEERDLLELRESELRRALKRLDRSVCLTVRSPNDPPLPATNAEPQASITSSLGSKISAQSEDDKQTASSAPASDATNATSATNGSALASNLQVQQDKADYKMLAERRLAEIEAKVRENTVLISQVDALKLQIASVPDHIVAETIFYKQTQSSRDYYSAQGQRLQAEVERLFAEIAELKSSRTEFEESILTESTSQRQSLEAEMQRLQNDLVRVRHHRDQIQRELEERRAQDSVEDQKSSELKLLSDVRRGRMNALISENKRLLAYVSVLKGDRAAFEAYTEEDLSKTTAVVDELSAKMDQIVRRENKLAAQLEALTVSSASATDDKTDAVFSTQATASSKYTEHFVDKLQCLQQETAALQARVRKYEEILGGVFVDEKGAIIESAALSRGEKLAAKQKMIDDLALERDSLLKTSEMMERELQTICESFAKLEEQNTSKVWDLSLKEQAIARVVAEKCKYEEKFIGLNKDRESQRLANQALRHQNTKQLEHIKAIEERDRMMSHQMSLMGNEAQQATSAWQATQTKLQEAQHRTQELEEQAKALEERARIATAALGERTEALAAVEHEKNRAQEALELANRRVSEAEKVTDQTGMAKLCADYKALLKCPTCQTNFKSHALLRCMHVFCKQCIDSRIETRQRKCPSCSEPFGAKDVRQIYL